MTATLRVQGSSSVPAMVNLSDSPDDATPATGPEPSQHSRSCDSRLIGTTADFRRGYQIAGRIQALHEPWRTRFVVFVAVRVGATVWPERLPSLTQLAVWLSNQQIARLTDRMLRLWTDEDR